MLPFESIVPSSRYVVWHYISYTIEKNSCEAYTLYCNYGYIYLSILFANVNWYRVKFYIWLTIYDVIKQEELYVDNSIIINV